MDKHPKVYFGGGGYVAVQKIGGSEVGKGQARWTKRKPSVYIGGAGISPSLLLGGGGIRQGGAVRLGEERRSAPKASAKVVKPKMGAEARVPPKEERAEEAKRTEARRETETEERLADFLEAAQAVLVSDGGTKPNPPAETAESIASREETSKAEETRCVLPELPLGEPVAKGVKKRRKRRGRKAKESTEVSEKERVGIQAELEAAGDAADNENN